MVLKKTEAKGGQNRSRARWERNIAGIAGENESPWTSRSVCGSKLGHFSIEQVSIRDGVHEWEAHFDREDYQPQPKPKVFLSNYRHRRDESVNDVILLCRTSAVESLNSRKAQAPICQVILHGGEGKD